MRKHRRKNNFFKSKILEYIENNAKYYILLLIVFFIGIILGILFLNNINDNGKLQISNYINDFLEYIRNNENTKINIIILESIKQNALMLILICFIGTTIIGAPLTYILILYKGCSFAYTISAIIGTLGLSKGLIISLAILVPYLIYIPSILSAGVSNIILNKEILKNKRLENLKSAFTKHLLMCLIMITLMIFSTIIQNYIWVLIKPIIVDF